ncbi:MULTISPECIES: hypothetical protein [unclassified Clostridium]|uniref:hypothetical protein n=1 Tax=unclassified Clostridium TaxID=2614128 RepID=UPI001FAB1A37|nr:MULTISPECIES: hypothetical protein [unclassified Clostridium]
MMLLSVISSMYEPAVTASIPLLVKEEHLEGANGLVNGVQALSIGAVAGKMRMDNLYRLLAAITLLILPMALSVTPALISCGFYPSYLLFLACAVSIAMIMTIISIFIVTKVQKETPNENPGKVMAIITAAAQCAAPLGQLVCGFIFQTFSARLYLPALFICIAMALVSLAARHLWAEITVS